MNKKFSIVVAFVMAMAGLGILPVHSALTEKGLIHPVNDFPTWFSDSKGVALQLCLDGDGANGLCFFDPIIPGNATSEVTGFGAEAFWWSAEASLDMPGGGSALLVLALEAAYAQEDPASDEQFAFGRVRLRVDTPVAGQYKIWHPFLKEANGCAPEVFNATAGRRAINITRDTGGGAPFDGMLKSEVGPFLTWDPAIGPDAPAGYVGDPNIEHAVVGGHCGINYFRIEGPVGSGIALQTNLFSVQGKIYDEANALPGLDPVRATYFRTTDAQNVTTGRVNVWAKAPSTATVRLDGLPSQNGAMTNDGAGTFYRRATLNQTTSFSIPDQVTITATNSKGSTEKTVHLSDQVSIQSAIWTKATQRLKVVALSSDKIKPSVGETPTLTLKIGVNTYPMSLSSSVLGRYEADVPGISAPPAWVTVASSQGGVDTQEVAD